ncbi:calcitonin receptor-like protein [Elysia marginata]|uniref:Calcitonin receptor-like protein n=1 Tax=Elysia marginata TaxID=1093978 RepID=A0AAV4F9F5_9GAST|nr:calcitonin receptor-like protein [Elysia marginata]
MSCLYASTEQCPVTYVVSVCLNRAMPTLTHVVYRISTPPGNIYCPSVFDDWLCWDHTLAGTTARLQCPYEFKEGFSEHRDAEKVCLEDGTWYVNPISNKTWTDYSNCAYDPGHLILYVSISGNCISCILLILSLIIFNYYRQLRCARVTLHQHLFISFILTGVMWIVTYSQGIARPGIRRKNEVWCKVVHILTQYASVSNYFWMLCEGFFLHTVVVLAFAKQKKLLIACYFLGWGVPLLFTIAYLVTKLIDTENDVM